LIIPRFVQVYDEPDGRNETVSSDNQAADALVDATTVPSMFTISEALALFDETAKAIVYVGLYPTGRVKSVSPITIVPARCMRPLKTTSPSEVFV
jgi:hypothetical protein